MIGVGARRAAVGIASAVLAVVVAVVVAHLAGLGFVVTHGTSMAPRFHTGDLAVTLASNGYRVGDVIAYHSPTLDTTVLHRVVRVESDRFVTQGDNNSWLDPDHPTTAEVQGRLALRIPRVGLVATTVRKPAVALSAALVILVAGAMPLGRRHRRRRVAVRTAPASPVRRSVPPPVLLAALGALGAVAVGAIWLAPAPTIAATTPAATATAPTGSQAEKLVITYGARTAAEATYPDGRVASGDPVFVKAVPELTVEAAYTGRSGTRVKLDAELAHPGGWHRALPLADPESTRNGNGATVSATLDVTGVAELLERFSEETGLPAPGTVLRLTATAGSWSTRGELTYDGVQFQPAKEGFTATRTAPQATAPQSTDPRATGGKADATSAAGAGKTAAGATTTSSGSASASTTPSGWRGLLAPLGRALPSVPLRAGATAGVLLLVAAGVHALRRRMRADGDELPADRLLPVVAHTPATGRTIVDVADPAALARIAEEQDRPIFQSDTPEGTTYLVDDGAVVYRLRPTPDRLPATVDLTNPRILAMVAEELRRPLAAVLGCAEILAEDPPYHMTPGQHTMLSAITRGAARLQQLGDTLSMLTDLESGSARPGNDLVDVGALIDERCRPLVQALAGREINIARELDPRLPLVHGDAAQLSRALDALLGSTVAASTAGSTITVRAHRADDHLTVSVTASAPAGRTVPARAEAVIDGDLELALASAVASNHHGQMNVTASEGSGRTATLELPAG